MWEKRLAPLSGVLFAVLLVGGFAVDPNMEFMPPEADVVARLQDGPLRVVAAAYLSFLAAAALLWFSGSVFKALRSMDDDEGRLSILAFGGGVFSSALLALGGVATIVAAERVWTNGTIDAGVAAALTDISAVAVGNGLPIGMAVLIGVWGIVSFQEPGRPRWVGWLSGVIALGLISPFGWVALGAGVLWVPAIAIWMFRNAPVRVVVMAE